MKCPNCGKIIANDSVFCEYCGTKLNGSAASENEQLQSPEKSNKKLWLFTLGVIVAVAAIVYISSNSSSDGIYMEYGDVDTVCALSEDEVIAETVAVSKSPIVESQQTTQAPPSTTEPTQTTSTPKPYPWSPYQKVVRNDVYFGSFTWNGNQILLSRLDINHMLKKKCYLVIWFRNAKGKYVKTSDPYHTSKNGYACYVMDFTPGYENCYWEKISTPVIDTSLMEANPGEKLYITWAVYAASSGKCIGKHDSDGFCYR